MRNLITECYDRTKDLLTEKKEELEVIAQELFSMEIIFENDLERLIGKRPFENETSYETYTKNTNGQHDDPKLDENKIVNGVAQNKNTSEDNHNLDKQ